MQFVSEIAAEALSFQWWMWAIPISLAFGILASKASAAPVWALIAVAVQFAGQAIGPKLVEGAPIGELLSQLTDKADGLNVRGYTLLFIEYFIFVYVIATVTLTRGDIDRPWPVGDEPVATPSKEELLKLAEKEGV